MVSRGIEWYVREAFTKELSIALKKALENKAVDIIVARREGSYVAKQLNNIRNYIINS